MVIIIIYVHVQIPVIDVCLQKSHVRSTIVFFLPYYVLKLTWSDILTVCSPPMLH